MNLTGRTPRTASVPVSNPQPLTDKAMPFIHEDFLLSTGTARKLYHQYAEAEPIFDYHCHLSPRDIAANRQFKNLFEIWLEGDHYKWRAMRTNGVAERFCTGNASPFDKFKAWAATVPHTLRNPLYHWTHLELTRYFGITDLLDEKTADKIWKLAAPELAAQGILKKMKVKVVCTTDDPADNYAFAAMIGNFQDGTIPGKLQFGSGWWFLDQKEGMEWQMNALSNLGRARARRHRRCPRRRPRTGTSAGAAGPRRPRTCGPSGA